MPWVGDRWNDRISAVACAPRCQLTAFEHIDFDGAGTDVRTAAFIGPDWNDRISSLEVRCERGGWSRWSERPRGERACTIYWDANFAGRREALEDGADIASIEATWNDQVSAIDCRPGCRLDSLRARRLPRRIA